MKSAFYDFQVSPFSYDFVPFLIGARSHGCKQVVFVPGDRHYQKCTPEQQIQRMENILKPLAKKYIVCTSREQAKAFWTEDCYPFKYTVEKPLAGHMHGYVNYNTKMLFPLYPDAESAKRVGERVGSRRPVVITVRESPIKPGRNSNLPEWLKVASWLKENGYWPVFVPDTDNIHDFGEFDYFSGAATNVQERIALYDQALVNLTINNGPAELLFWSQRPCLIFKYHNEQFLETSSKWHEKNLLPVGSQPSWFTDRQRIVWQDDKAETIIERFQKWVEVGNGGKWEPHLVPPLPIRSAMPDKERNDHMEVALKQGYERLEQAPSGSGEMTIVCYGPSLGDEIENIRKAPRPLITVSGAHDFLINRGIVPDFHMDSDPRPHKAMFTEFPHEDVTYVMASCCHPKVWENLKGQKVLLWHLDNGEETMKWLEENDPLSFCIGGGSTAGLRAIEIGLVMGKGKFHIFGMDCSFKGKQWAGKHSGQAHPVMRIKCAGKDFETSGLMIQAARELIEMKEKRNLDVKIYGDGLLPSMLEEQELMAA
jgi:hypothetical protein